MDTRTRPKAGDRAAVVAYDKAFEKRLTNALGRVIVAESSVGDGGLMLMRYGETLAALANLIEVVENFAARGGGGRA